MPSRLRAHNYRQNKVRRVMHEFYHRQLHSGSKHGPLVTNVRQARAIALHEARSAKR